MSLDTQLSLTLWRDKVAWRMYAKNSAPWMVHTGCIPVRTRGRFFARKPGEWDPYGKWPPRRGAGYPDKRPALRRLGRTSAVAEQFTWVSGQADHIDVA